MLYCITLRINKTNGALELDILLNGDTPENYFKNEFEKNFSSSGLQLIVKEVWI